MSVNILYGDYIYVNTFNVMFLGNSPNRNEVTSSVRNGRHKIRACPPDVTQIIHSLCRDMIQSYKYFTSEIGSYQGEMLKLRPLLFQR
jgi:hypothetical protein